MLSVNARVEDEETEALLIYLEQRFGNNHIDKLELLSTARQWLELEDKIPTAFTPYQRRLSSHPSVAAD